MRIEKRTLPPRLPLDGSLDLTYRCNNNCRHCWLWLPTDAPQAREELNFDEIRYIVTQARAMGCQSWSLSGGEPMLHPDFEEIFSFITHKSLTYKINTNGTLITPGIARLLKRSGKKMVALYGATPEVHDRITRNPGSFEATMRGIAYLKEAGVHFIIQVVPLRDNYFQYNEMVTLAQALNMHYRVGAPWLWLSSSHSPSRNRQIEAQRLPPAEVIKLDPPSLLEEEIIAHENAQMSETERHPCASITDDRLYASCIDSRRSFHIDPYGQISFCYYIKDPAMRYDLRSGTFQQAWDEFIPSLKDMVRGGAEFRENCGSCNMRKECRWCAVYGYLEHGRHAAKVEYLCEVAREVKKHKQQWMASHILYYQIADITFQVAADFELSEDMLLPAYRKFRIDSPGKDIVTIHHKTPLPDLSTMNLGRKIYSYPPWEIYQQRDALTYIGHSSATKEKVKYTAIFTLDHRHGTIYHHFDSNTRVQLDNLYAFPSDQMVLARLLADRQACIVHAGGLILDGKGLLFIGHSEAGKTTLLKMAPSEGEILCDDRIIIRCWPDGIRIHGTWSHGDLPDVSPASAPLTAVFYLEKTETNQIIPITDKMARLGKLTSFLIRPFATSEWWTKTIDLAFRVSTEIPAYRLQFDKSGEVFDILKKIR